MSTDEVEEVFSAAFRFSFIAKGDVAGENLCRALGQTSGGRYLAVFFLYKGSGRALPISARDMIRRSEETMRKNRIKSRDPLPAHFSSIEEAGAFWDSHSSADYEEYMRDAHFEVDLKRSVHEVRITNQLLREVRRIARKQGVGAETLVNLWLHEKITKSVAQVDDFERDPISPMRTGRAISFDE